MGRTMKKRGNGEGTIYYKESRKKWIGQVSIGVDNEGKQIRKTFYGDTRKEVKDKMDEMYKQIASGYDVKNKDTLVDIANQIRELKYKTNTIRKSSYSRLGETIKVIEKTLPFANIPIQNVTRKMISTQVQELTEYSQSVITKVWQQLQGAFNEAKIRDIVEKNPFELKGYIIKPKSTKKTKSVDALTVDEENRFLAELEKGYDNYNIVFYIAIYTGMRISEILALEYKDIDLENRKIYVRKTLSHAENKVFMENVTKTYAGMRDVPILNALYDKLVEFKKGKKRGFAFLNNGHFYHASSFNARFQKICKNADIRVYYRKIKVPGGRKTKKVYECEAKKSKVNFHMLRHTFATRCIENGINPVVLQKILGHSDINVTLNTYTSVFDEFKISEFDKMNAIF